MTTSLNKCVPTADLMSACRAAIGLGANSCSCLGSNWLSSVELPIFAAGEAFVMWCVSHGSDSVSNAACKSYADAIASLLPMLTHFAPMNLGWRNKLVVRLCFVPLVCEPHFGVCNRGTVFVFPAVQSNDMDVALAEVRTGGVRPKDCSFDSRHPISFACTC
jgi:hypothetical protein